MFLLRKTIWSVAFLLAVQLVFAQTKKAGALLIQIEPGFEPRQVVQALERSTGIPVLDWQAKAPKWRIYLLQMDPSMSADADDQLLNAVRNCRGVALAQWNREVETRDVSPNDEFWIEQRDMGLIGMKKAWENTTGGITPAGDTIVVAVLEKGMQKDHPDLVANLWRNRLEIPDNGIDDDNNGYVDDYLGWDASGTGDGNGTGSSHGTSVCGIIGAKGNNEFGVSGVNWNVQMMTFVNVRFEDEIVAAYYYAGEMRRLYNESGGQKGAFVVTTNASFGIDNAFPEDYPLWCAVYDSLGKVGIVSVGATANASRDVDQSGDMPTTCGSEYLITVTNVDAFTGKRVTNAGYGSTSIDIGAPGQGSFTTTNRVVTQQDTTWCGSFGGTSAACPHAAGAVALLYSVQCPGFAADALTQPVKCARRVRDALLLNVSAEPTLEGVSTTGGRLDVAATVEDIMELCSGTTGPLDLADLRPNPARDWLEIRYQTPDYNADYTLRVFDALGRLMLGRDINGDIVTDVDFAPPAFEAKRLLLNINSLPPGAYILVLSQGKTQVQKKFVKI